MSSLLDDEAEKVERDERGRRSLDHHQATPAHSQKLHPAGIAVYRVSAHRVVKRQGTRITDSLRKKEHTPSSLSIPTGRDWIGRPQDLHADVG